MGTKMAPSYANLFMGVLEHVQQMLSSYKYKPLAYFRYIDDIFMIWAEGEETLTELLTHCNNQNKLIHFEQTISKNSIPFLDVSVILENGKLTTDLYSKSTDKHQLLYSTSCHPKHTKTSLPYCLALCVRRIVQLTPFFKNVPMKWNTIFSRGAPKKAVYITNKRSQKS